MLPHTWIKRLRHDELQKYVERTGNWAMVPSKRDCVALYKHWPSGSVIQIPLDASLVDYVRTMASAVEEFSEIEGRAPEHILTELVGPAYAAKICGSEGELPPWLEGELRDGVVDRLAEFGGQVCLVLRDGEVSVWENDSRNFSWIADELMAAFEAGRAFGK